MLNSRDRDEIATNYRSLLKSRSHLGPATCCTLLELWLSRKIEITEDDFDSLVGQLHDHLEKAYDERYRLIARKTRDTVPDYDEDEDDEE